MAPEADPAELVGLEPDERLLSEDVDLLPEAVGRPEQLPQSAARRRIVGLGATLTGVSLIGGVGLIILGLVVAISSALGAGAILLIALGVVLVSTHWGWVHVAELSANSLDRRRHRALLERRRLWLAEIQPYTRYEVSAETREDGSIVITTTRFRPVRHGEHAFTFVQAVAAREVHSGEEPAAAVAERAELLRRQAALNTEQERLRYEAGRDAYETARLAHADEEQRVAAVRAASEALSAQINANLRDPPLTE